MLMIASRLRGRGTRPAAGKDLLDAALGFHGREDLVNDAFRLCGSVMVAVQRTRVGDQRLPQRPPPPTGPRAGVDVDPGPERVAARSGQQRPGDRQVARGVPDTAGAEVDDSSQRAVT